VTTLELQADQPTVTDSIFTNRNFRLLWLGEAISLVGDQFYLIALPWLVLQITGNALAMGTMMAVGGIPRAAFMLLGGALSDRFQPRTVMLSTNLIRMALVAILSGIVIAGVTELWMLYIFALVFGLADAFFFPAQGAIVPRVIHRPEHLQTANSIIQGTAQFSLFAGPVLAGIIIALLDGNDGDTTGIGVALGIDAITFLASACSLWLMKTVAPSSEEESQSPLHAIRDGLAYTWNNKLLRYFFTLIGLANIFINGPLMVGIPVLADSRLPEGAAAFGIVMSAFGGGSLVGIILAGLLPKLGFRSARRTIIWVV
jgi:MFS family permease